MKMQTHPDLGNLPEHWGIATLGKVADITKLAGYEFTKHIKYIEDGEVIALRSLNVVDGQLDVTNIKRIAKSVSDALPRSKLFINDLLLTYTGSKLGDTALIDANDKYHLAPNVCRLRANEDDDAYFLYVFLRSKIFSNLLDNYKVGSGQPTVPMKNIRKIPLPWPPKKERVTIGRIFSGLTDKIELNRQTNQTLEHIAQAIFKSWFVDFEPTRAKIAAKQRWQALHDTIETSSPTCYADQTDNAQNPPSLEETMTRAAMAAISGKSEEELDQLDPETQQHLKTTAALFPDALVDSELGEIPQGWVVGSIGDVAVAKGGYAFKGKSFVEEGNPVVKIKNITGNGSVDLSGAVCIDNEQAELANRFKLNDGDLLMAMTGATVGKIGFVVTLGQSVYLNQRVAKFESEKFGSKVSWLLFCCFQRDSIFDSVVGAAHGSAQPNISSSGIEATRIVLPSDTLINVFCEKTDPLFSKWLSGIQENAYLEACRDELLPKLLSGEIGLEEAV